MQTFLPYPDFEKSAKCLDYRRLGKQRVETWQILQTIVGNSDGWKNHPAVKMWRKNTDALCAYGRAICREWISRGYKDTMLDRFSQFEFATVGEMYVPPIWFGNKKFHSAHRAALLKKFPSHYKQFGWKEKPKIQYYWPV
jgi:hypothetical protein